VTERRQVELTHDEERENSRAVLAHALPFAIWLTMFVWFDNYNARTIGGLIVLAIFRPWRWYPPLKLKNVPAAIGVGIFILVVWVGLESPWVVQHAPGLNEWYDRLFVEPMKPLKTRELFDIGNGVMAPYEVIESGENAGLHKFSPQATGWFAFWVHMFGTTVIIAIIEEFFYRGFLYRWMQGSPFFKLDASVLNWPMLLLISVFFSVSHFEIGAAVICGVCYGLLYIKTRDIWASIIAHGTTNFLLGLYVIKYNAYQFW
jgi:membrane protease YdiL (CAAX protease family)